MSRHTENRDNRDNIENRENIDNRDINIRSLQNPTQSRQDTRINISDEHVSSVMRDSEEYNDEDPRDLMSICNESDHIDDRFQTDNQLSQKDLKMVKNEIRGYYEKINYDVGFYWWKRYIYFSFWSNISTPINLIILICSALTTGQSATNSIINSSTSTYLGIVVLIVTIFNTFFKPNDQMNYSKHRMNIWSTYGTAFETIYFDHISYNNNSIKKAKKLRHLFIVLNKSKRVTDTNSFIDILYSIFRLCLGQKKLLWIPDLILDKEIELVTCETQTQITIQPSSRTFQPNQSNQFNQSNLTTSRL